MKLTHCLVAAGIATIVAGCHTEDANIDVDPSNTTYVVTVGMENSAKFGSCPGAEYDATRMTSLLKNYTPNVVSFISSEANKAKVVTAMKEAVAKAELFIFYYSGHGTTSNSGNPAETDGQDELLCLNDDYFLDDDIWEIISQSKGRVMLVFDCCHSKTMYRAKNPITFAKQFKALKATTNETGPINMICWSGCPDDTYSYGSSSGGEMTNSLLRHFDANKSYKELWTEMEADDTLQSYEEIQCTIMGADFGDTKVFQ